MNNFSIGMRVVISPRSLRYLTVEAVRNFRISGKTKIKRDNRKQRVGWEPHCSCHR